MTLNRPLHLILMLLLAIAVAGCSSTGDEKGGGYYRTTVDANPPSNLDQVPDAVPRIEPYASGANRPYVVFGQRYVPDTTGQPYRKQGRPGTARNSTATPRRSASPTTCTP